MTLNNFQQSYLEATSTTSPYSDPIAGEAHGLLALSSEKNIIVLQSYLHPHGAGGQGMLHKGTIDFENPKHDGITSTNFSP